MAWTATNPVIIGQSTKKSGYDTLWVNAEYLYNLLTNYSGAIYPLDLIAKGPWVDIRAYLPAGYVTDGSIDYYTQIQAAFTAGAGKHVHIPYGTYKTSAHIDVASGTLVTGMGRGSKIIASALALNNDLPVPDGPGASAVFYVVQNASNVVFRDLFVAGVYSGTGASDITFGIYLGTGTSNCTIENVWLEDHSWSGLLVHGSGHLIRGNHTKHNAIDGFEISNANNIVITDNYSDGDGAATANGVAGIEIAVTTSSTGIIISNNIIKSSCGEGIYTSPSPGISLTNLTITGNTIITPARKGISVAVNGAIQTDVLIADNIIDTPAGSGALGHGIFIYDVTRFTVKGNSVRGASTGSGPSGIRIDGASAHGIISGNILTANWIGLDVVGTSNNLSIFSNDSYTNVSANMVKTTSGVNILIHNNPGFNPRGALAYVGGNPVMPASDAYYQNDFGYSCLVTIYGGTVTGIVTGNTAGTEVPTGLTSGSFVLPPGAVVRITYSVAPTWVWYGL